MALQKSVVQLPFKGLQTKVDPKMAPAGTYSILDNVIMERYPELQKRSGLLQIGANTTPPNINSIYSYLTEMGVITNEGVYAYSPSLDEFLNKGLSASPIIASTTVISNTYSQTNSDSGVTTSGIQGTIWEDSRGGVRCCVQDSESDTYLINDFALSSTGIKPRAIAFTKTVTFFWVDSVTGYLMGRQYDADANDFFPERIVLQNLASVHTYDCCVSTSNIAIIAVTTTPNPSCLIGIYWSIVKANVAVAGDNLSLQTTINSYFATSGTPCLCICADVPTNTGYISITFHNDLKIVATMTVANDFIVIQADTVVDTTGDDPFSITSCVDKNNNTYIFYSTHTSYYTTYQAKVSANKTSPTVVYSNLFFVQMVVMSRALYFSSNAYVILSYYSPSNLQSTYFGVRDDGACWARMFSQVAGGIPSKLNYATSICARISKPDTYLVALPRIVKILSNGGQYTLQTSIFNEQIFFTPSGIDNKPLGSVLFIAGGYLKSYDGSATVYEQGFHLYPDQPYSSIASNSDSAIPSGTYSYIVCWEWTDNRGNLYRSETSIPLTVTIPGGMYTVTIIVPSLPITNKETRFSNTRTNPVVALYRTRNLGTTYYRVNQYPAQWYYNDPTQQTVYVVDNSPDSVISSNSLLYTTGGVFDNIPLPSTNLMCVSKNRVIVAASDVSPNQVFFSKEIQGGLGIEFSAELSFLVDSQGGPITALAALDDKILIFKETLIYYVSAVFPDNLGNGAAPYPLLVTTTCGCNYPQSIVLTPEGIAFQSPKGIYLVDRTLNVSYVGQAIDKYTTDQQNPIQITSAVNMTNQNIVVFTNETNNQGFVYDTFFDQWYTQSYLFSPVSSNILLNNWYVCSSTEVYKQVLGQTFDKTSTSITSTIQTNWISLNQVNGFGRVYAIFIYGSGSNNPGTLRANLYYDFQDYSVESVSIIPYDLASATYWGSDTTWGSSSPYGGSFDGTYNFMILPARQKCSAIRIEIYDDFPDGNTSASFSFSGITLGIGIIPTWNKSLNVNRRMK